MTATNITTRALFSGLALAIVSGAALIASPAEAGRGKDYYSETYRFNKPHNGYSGFSGAYYCDYQKKPVRECNGKRCKTVWLLRQHCY